MKTHIHLPDSKEAFFSTSSATTNSGFTTSKQAGKASILAGLLALAGMTIFTGGCGSKEAGSEGSGQSAFRFRSGFEAELNADEGWAGKLNESVAINADQPFRIRFEIEPSAETGGGPFGLQYRRNGGAWTPVEAHDFPYPEREVDLDFKDIPAGETPEGWSIEPEGHGQAMVTQEADEKLLDVQAPQEPLLILHRPPWEVTEIAAEIRLSPDNPPGAGFVFAYTDSQNYCRVFLDTASKSIRVSRLVRGAESILAEQKAEIPAGQWMSLEVGLENETSDINFQDDALEFEVDMGTATPSSQVGFYLPAGGAAAFRDVSLGGEASTPRVSIVSCPAFENGAATTNLLAASTAPFQEGAGMTLSGQTPAWKSGKAHSEFEWALVVRRFADGAATNEEGDTFEFRMVTVDGSSLGFEQHPKLRLAIPPGHLGGTFVETPGRIGPWQASNGDLYFIMEPTETDNLFMMVKSTDHGLTWKEADGANRPATGDLEAVDGRQVGDTIYILHQVTESSQLHVFRTSDHPTHPDTWAFTDELAAEADSMAQAATLALRSDGSMVAFYVGQTLHYNVRSSEGIWGRQVIIDPDLPAAAGPKAVAGADDTVHVAYYRTDGTLWYRSLLKNGPLTPAQQLASGAGTSRAEYGAVLPLVYIPETETVVILYRLDDGFLYERRIDNSGTLTNPLRVSDRPVVTDAVDSQQAGADVVLDGQTLHVLFIDEETRSIWHTHDHNAWQPATRRIGNILGSWVRGSIFTRPDKPQIYGFVYDAGSDGGAGMNRFAEVELGRP